jgi:hypothetical protein
MEGDEPNQCICIYENVTMTPLYSYHIIVKMFLRYGCTNIPSSSVLCRYIPRKEISVSDGNSTILFFSDAGV